MRAGLTRRTARLPDALAAAALRFYSLKGKRRRSSIEVPQAIGSSNRGMVYVFRLGDLTVT